SAGAWADAVRRLDAVNHELVERVGLLVDADLDRFVAGQDVSVYTTLHGVIQHDIYHAGQIALLKKALR
ncbi:MAG: DinB family protein, partial [Longimicrobiales bacterium]